MIGVNTMLELQYLRIVLVFAFTGVSIGIYTYIYSILKFTCRFHNSSRKVVCISLYSGNSFWRVDAYM